MRQNAVDMLRRHHRQLSDWLIKIEHWRDQRAAHDKDAASDCLNDLLSNDPLLAGFSLLSPDVQSRERFFLLNSVKGYWEYLSNR